LSILAFLEFLIGTDGRTARRRAAIRNTIYWRERETGRKIMRLFCATKYAILITSPEDY